MEISHNTYHQFIVTGASTGGKSAFSYELIKKYFVQHICIDPIVDAFQSVFPELGITHEAPDLASHLEVCKKFKPFVFEMINQLDEDDFVIEGFRLPLEDIHDAYPHLQYFVFGYPTATPEQKVAEARQYRGYHWTSDLSDDELKESFKFSIEESKRLQDICLQRGIPFFDTTIDYAGQVKAALVLTK